MSPNWPASVGRGRRLFHLGQGSQVERQHSARGSGKREGGGAPCSTSCLGAPRLFHTLPWAQRTGWDGERGKASADGGGIGGRSHGSLSWGELWAGGQEQHVCAAEHVCTRVLCHPWHGEWARGPGWLRPLCFPPPLKKKKKP